MLEIRINGEALDLGTDPSITIDEESPVFDKDSIPGGFAFPFSLPVTPRNRRILGFPERIEKNGPMSQVLPFQIFHSGKLWLSGTLSVTEAGSDYRAYLKVGSGDYAGAIGDTRLRDLEYGGIRTWEFLGDYVYPASDFALFPIYNPKFMDGLNPQKAVTWLGNKNRLNSYEDGDWFQDFPTNMAICPYPYLAYVVERVFTHFGYPVRENILASDPELRTLVMYSTWNIAEYVTTYHTRTMTFQGPFGMETRTITYAEVENDFDHFDLKDSLPDITIKEFLLALRNLLNLAIIIDATGSVHIVRRKDLLSRTPDSDITHLATDTAELSSITQPDGIKLCWEHDSNDLLVSEGFKDVYEQEELLKDPCENMTELLALTPTINEIRLVRSMQRYYQYAGTEDEGTHEVTYAWEVYSNDFQNLKIGNGKDVFTSGISTLQMVSYQRIAEGPFIRIPWAEQQGNGLIRPERLPFTLRLLFYRGRIHDDQAGFYPYGSSDPFDMTGTPLAGCNLSLRWDGPYGLYENLWKEYITWWMSRKQVTMTITDPSILKFNEKYAIDGKHYLLKKRTINLRVNSIEPGECEFYLV